MRYDVIVLNNKLKASLYFIFSSERKKLRNYDFLYILVGKIIKKSIEEDTYVIVTIEIDFFY